MRSYSIDPADGFVVVRGAVEIERTSDGILPHRLPAWARAQVPDAFMRQTAAESAGVRLAFRTAATRLELDVRARRMVPDAATAPPPSIYELTTSGEVVARGGLIAPSRYLFTFENPTGEIVEGSIGTVVFDGLPPGERELELWLPYTDAVELVALRADRSVAAPAAASTSASGMRPRWVHHGSSISHGYIADSTTGTWPVIAARFADVELTNLAFSGNAVLDPFVARVIRDTEADVISVKVGINIVNGDLMRQRAFRTAVEGYIDTIRDGHPDTPLIMVSAVYCGPVEDVAGPTIQDPTRAEPWSIAGGTVAEVAEGKLSLVATRAIIRSVVERRAASDPHLSYVDGLTLYGRADAATMPLPDNLHPGPDVQRLIGERFARALSSV